MITPSFMAPGAAEHRRSAEMPPPLTTLIEGAPVTFLSAHLCATAEVVAGGEVRPVILICIPRTAMGLAYYADHEELRSFGLSLIEAADRLEASAKSAAEQLLARAAGKDQT